MNVIVKIVHSFLFRLLLDDSYPCYIYGWFLFRFQSQTRLIHILLFPLRVSHEFTIASSIFPSLDLLISLSTPHYKVIKMLYAPNISLYERLLKSLGTHTGLLSERYLVINLIHPTSYGFFLYQSGRMQKWFRCIPQELIR